MGHRGQDLAGLLRQAGVARGGLAGLVVAPDGRAAVAPDFPAPGSPAPESAVPDSPAQREADAGWIVSAEEVARADQELRPRWVTWSAETAARLTQRGVRLTTCWDVAAVHRLLFGGWLADPALAWASIRGLRIDGIPTRGPGQLFSAIEVDGGRADDGDAGGDADGGDAAASASPVGPGGYLRPEWTDGGWADSTAGMIHWARLALETASRQGAALHAADPPQAAPPARPIRSMRQATAHAESTAELLCAELAADGLPVDREVAERLLAGIVGPRPRDASQAAGIRAARDARVLRHAPQGVTADLRSPLQVKALLKSAGFDVPDTRAWRLEQFKDASPLIAALLEWRKAERIATTYGYAWLDACLGADGRLRGSWTGSDGAAGRMTASAGLHNMPAILRQAVIAEDGRVFIRADLGQIEPRVLAAVSGDRTLIAATEDDDLYLPVARALNVDRPTAKVAMIAAMYGQTTGHGGQAAKRMKAAYPVAMAYLDDADRRARAGQDLRTYGGRLVRMSGGDPPPPAAQPATAQTATAQSATTRETTAQPSTARESAARVAARGRYGRNAMIQGAAAELFKMWAVTVRARGAALDARIVLCLHDELLVDVPAGDAAAAAGLVLDCLAETTRRWAPGQARFLADISAVSCWADAKPSVKPASEADTVTASIGCQEGA
jgi:DNA polymerase-1